MSIWPVSIIVAKYLLAFYKGNYYK